MSQIGLKSIRELFGKRFFIPSYQRGYRWTQRQIYDLLEDIFDYKFKNLEKGEFYCLQPLVVKQMTKEAISDNNLDGEEWFEVIDGQQRLTTIHLIMCALGKSLSDQGYEEYQYTIKYQRHSKTQEDLFEQIINDASHRDEDPIDIYYLKEAYSVITKWLKELPKKGMSQYKYREPFIEYEPIGKRNVDKANNIRVIWYESTDENPVDVFTRLNIGKISLTNAELIKALLLNKSHLVPINSNRNEMDVYEISIRQQEIGADWDRIESTLQDNEFWLFLNKNKNEQTCRINFIFKLIADKNLLGIASEQIMPEIIGESDDEYRTFRYFNEYIKQCLNEKADADDDEFEEDEEDCPYQRTIENSNLVISECWNKVKFYFQTFEEWFNDILLYHYVGFLITVGEGIDSLINAWNASDDRSEFVKYLKKCIRKKVKPEEIDKIYEINGPAKTTCRPLLLFHNIQTVINQNDNYLMNDSYRSELFYKFPFHLYKLEKWDVEHINSATTNNEGNDSTREEWLCNVYMAAEKNIPLSAEPQEGIVWLLCKSLLTEEEGKIAYADLKSWERPYMSKKEKEQFDNWIDSLPEQTTVVVVKEQNEELQNILHAYSLPIDHGEVSLKALIEKFFILKSPEEKTTLYQRIKKEFVQEEASEEWSDEDKNRVWNFTLLDAKTNRSYHNAIFSSKRRVIIDKDSGKVRRFIELKDGRLSFSEIKDGESSFVPPCTINVFLKYYSPSATSRNYWTLADAQNYKKDIMESLKYLD